MSDQNPQPETAKAFIESLNLEYSAEFVPFKLSRHKDNKQPCLNWRVTIKRANAPAAYSLTTDYMQGVGHLPKYTHNDRSTDYAHKVRHACETGFWKPRQRFAGNTINIPKPKLCDVLYCLVMDADVFNYSSFEDWAESFGYDTDSREAEKTYNSCMQQSLQLKQLIDLDAAAVAFADY